MKKLLFYLGLPIAIIFATFLYVHHAESDSSMVYTLIGTGSVGSSQLAATQVTAGSYNAANLTVDADGRLTFASQGQLTSLSDVSSSTKTAGRILVANGTTFASVAISGNMALTSAGVLTFNEDKPMIVYAAPSITNISNKTINSGTLNAISCFTDTGTVTLDFQQCITTHNTGCNSLLSSSMVCSASGVAGTINSAASALTGGYWLHIQNSNTSGSPTYWSVTPNIKQ